MKIQIKHSFNSAILFEHECENNTIKQTLIKGVKMGADFQGADLYGATLYGADLRGAKLENSNLEGSTLYGANLRNANLYGANLRGANLYGANLEGSKLYGANLPIFSKWNPSIINNRIIKIGCKKMTIDEWDLFFASEEEFETKRGTADFKQIEAIYLAIKAYLNHLNS